MIAKMKFLKVTAPIDEFDRIIDQYISKYEIQIENTVAELKDITNLRNKNENNPFKEFLAQANEYASLITEGEPIEEKLTMEEANAVIREFALKLNELEKGRTVILTELEHKKELLRDIIPYSAIHYDVQALLNFRFVKYRFGRIGKEFYKKIGDFMQDDMCSVFCECASDSDYVWGVYFVPDSEAKKVDAVYSSMHFERFRLSDEYEGPVDEARAALEKEVEVLEKRLAHSDKRESALKEEYASRVLNARNWIDLACKNYDIRKQVAFTKSASSEFFILCGWMLEEDAYSLKQDVIHDEKVYVMFEDKHEGPFGGAPIKLKNPKILKPFEMLIRMYGLPDYNEFDPTWFVAISYTILFGMMFGDVGQGICLAIGGFLLYHFKKMNLAAIIGVAGIFSTIFGFLFGSIFGYEHIIDALWMRPTESMTNLPFVGKMNTIFATAIFLGMCLILLMMVFNIINAIKAKRIDEVLFDHNGVAGFVFYGAIVVSVVTFMTGHKLPGAIILAVMFGLPLLLIVLKEPLMAIVFKHADAMPKEKGIFVVQVFFELFEILLSYFSNTLSFVRIGGFAVSHASMMAVVLMLAGAEHGEIGNIFVIILGNILVCGLEGLIVGIQVMRLEYYEMFSRFYKGGGREFKPYKEIIKHN